MPGAAQPKLFGSLVVQNEADVIGHLLDFLRDIDVFDEIFFFDLGSKDETFRIAQRYGDLLHEPRVVNEIYTNRLRDSLLLEHSRLYRPGDWLAIIDADEFYAEDPRPILALADREGADHVATYQAEFRLTAEELKSCHVEEPSRPIYERRRHYLIDWCERRFYKLLPGDRIAEQNACSRKLLNRHYPYRTLAQASLRIETRLANRSASIGLPEREPWQHLFSDDWRDYVGIPRALLHEYRGGDLLFGLPPGRQPTDYAAWDRTGFGLAENAVRLQKERIAIEGAVGPTGRARRFLPKIETEREDPTRP